MKLKKEFIDFYKNIRIDSETSVLKEKREILESDIKNKFPDILSNHNISISVSDIRMIDQGSYCYHTTIKSDIVDRDVAVIIPLDISQNNDPRLLKGYLKDSINIQQRTVTIKEPCVTASYHENGEEWLHIDMPLYAKDGGEVYLARGKMNNEYSWEVSDPDGLNKHIHEKLKDNDQLRRVICYIKKWRNEKYKVARKHEAPASIGLTLLACSFFSPQLSWDGDDNDLLALQKTMKSILDRFIIQKDFNGNVISACLDCYLPVQPYSDVFKKMKDINSDYMITFYNRLAEAVENLVNALNVESEHDAGVYVRNVLGSEFTVPPKEAVLANTRNVREHSFG